MTGRSTNNPHCIWKRLRILLDVLRDFDQKLVWASLIVSLMRFSSQNYKYLCKLLVSLEECIMLRNYLELEIPRNVICKFTKATFTKQIFFTGIWSLALLSRNPFNMTEIFEVSSWQKKRKFMREGLAECSCEPKKTIIFYIILIMNWNEFSSWNFSHISSDNAKVNEKDKCILKKADTP
jgi:hypothetical protein